MNALFANRESLFERVYPVTPKIAERLIASGYRFPSRFGRWCPVTRMQRNAWIQPVPVPSVRVPNSKYIEPLPGVPGETLPQAKPITCAAVYGDNVYWFKSPAARTLFSKNPLHFLQNQPNPPIMMPLRLSIMGPPKSGKTTRELLRFVEETISQTVGLFISNHEVIIPRDD